jgi:hypothetical protein
LRESVTANKEIITTNIQYNFLFLRYLYAMYRYVSQSFFGGTCTSYRELQFGKGPCP